MPGYEVPGASRRHDTPPWRWDETRKFWVLDDSDSGAGARPNQRYNCVQYAMAKLAGTAPDLTRQPDSDRIPENTETYLRQAGYATTNCAECGCRDGALKDCAVVFKTRSAPQTVFHVAVFDREFCDWGGKLSGAGPIARFKDPVDYVRTLEPTEQEDTSVECWCRPGTGGPPPSITDEDLRDRAKGPPPHGVSPTPPPTQDNDGCLRRFFVLAIAAVIGIAALLR